MKYIALCFMVLFSLTSSGFAGTEVVGQIKSLEGRARILRGDLSIPVAVGDKLYAEDVISTGSDSALGFMLEDGTVLSLGPDSRLELKNFVFDPPQGVFALSIKLLKGSFAFMSGIIGKLAPEKVHIETPDAVIATRGTHFAVRVEDRP